MARVIRYPKLDDVDLVGFQVEVDNAQDSPLDLIQAKFGKPRVSKSNRTIISFETVRRVTKRKWLVVVAWGDPSQVPPLDT